MTKKRFSFILSLSALFVQAGIAQTTPIDSTIILQNIEVQGRRFSQLSGGGIKRLHVEDNLSVVTGTTAEALRQLPSFTTDIEGNTLFRGSSKSAMLLNGIPYGLMDENSGDVLIQLPAFFFHTIQLSTAPGIDCIPDGSGSLLNLLPETNKAPTSLLVNLGAGLQNRYNVGAAQTLDKGKFHLVGKYNYRREYRERTFSKTQTTAAGTTIMNNNAAARPDVHIADLSIGYDLSAKDKLSVYGLFYAMDYSRYGGINNTKLNPAGNVITRMLRHRYNDQNQQAYAAEARWSHLFSTPGEALDVVFHYNNFAYDENNHFENENQATGKVMKQDNLFVNQDKHQYYLSVGYRKAFTPSLFFKAGYIGRAKNDTYTNRTEDLVTGVWVPNVPKSYDFGFNRTTNMLYSSVSKDFRSFNAEIGLQGEHTWQETKTAASGQLTHDSRFRVYPQARLSYESNKTSRFMLSYVQRTDQPLSKDLNPFIDNSDALNITEGNPYLKPERIHLAELSYTYTTEFFRLAPTVYYRYRSNRIADIAVENGSDVIWKKENLGDTQTAGMELAVYWFPLRILSIGVSGNVFRDEIDGRGIGFSRKKSMVCLDTKGDIKINITPTTELQLDGFYISDQLTPQGKIKSHYTVNAGASQYFLHRSLRANVSINNIFNSLGETTSIDSETMKLTQIRNRDAQVSWLTLTYVW